MPKAPVDHGFPLAIEYFREEDGRWLADIPALPGVTSYGRTKKQATVAVQALALRLIAGRLEHGEARISGGASDRLAHQTSERNLAPHPGTSRLARCLVCLP
jgi:predicted RNase H-like HicB family nuclease